MSYSLLYADKAVGQLGPLPAEFVDPVESELLRLAATPATLSVPIASPPFPPRGQLYHFELTDSAGVRWFFTVIFRYSQDETALHVLSVTWRELIEG
jgi:hypothetical protein